MSKKVNKGEKKKEEKVQEHDLYAIETASFNFFFLKYNNINYEFNINFLYF